MKVLSFLLFITLCGVVVTGILDDRPLHKHLHRKLVSEDEYKAEVITYIKRVITDEWNSGVNFTEVRNASDFTTLLENSKNLLRRVGYASAPAITGPWTRCETAVIDVEANNPALL